MQHKKTNLVSVIGTGRSDSYSSGTAFARQGSNFGLPIALNLAKLMNGGIGIVQVRLVQFLFLRWYFCASSS